MPYMASIASFFFLNLIFKISADIKVLLVTSPAWPPVMCGRQGRAIVANQAST